MAQMGQPYQTAQQYQYPQQYQQSQNNSQYAAAQHYQQQQQQQQQQYNYAANQQSSQQYPQGHQQQNYQQYQPQQYNAQSQNQQYSQQYPHQHSQQYAQQYAQQYPQQYQQYTEQSQQYPQQAQQYPQQTQQYPQQTQQYPQQAQQYSQHQQQQYTQQSQQHQQYSSQQQSPQYSQYAQYSQQQQGNAPSQGTGQDQTYAHPYQAQPQQNFVQPALPGQETCYNCGAPNHMAQNCPEPRREVPAGLIKRQKRQYYPKNLHSYNASMNTSTPQPQVYNQSAFAQNQAYSPVTPNSARSSFSQQWQSVPYQQQGHAQQQQQPFQQDQQTAQQSPYQSQSSPHNFSSYSMPATPGTNAQFDFTHQNQTAAPQCQHNDANEPAQSALHRSMPPADNQPDAVMDGQNPQVETEEDSANVDDEPEEDNLTSLDVPDLPLTTEQYGEAVIRPVGRALPSNSIVADAISPLPAPEIDGRCKSKYYENVGKILEMQEISVSPYWKDVQDDTIFRPIVDEGKTKSVEECLEKVQQRLKPQSEEEVLHKSRSESRSVAPRSAEAIGMAESLETLERALAEAKAKQAEMIRNRKRMKQRRESDTQHSQSENAMKSPMVKKEHQSPPFSASPDESAVEPRSTEDVLASLGVTGASKSGTAVTGRGNQRSSSTMSPHYPKQQTQQLHGVNGHVQCSPPSKPHAQHFPPTQTIQTPTYGDGSNLQSPDSGRRLYTNGTNGNGPYPYSVEESTLSPTQYLSERSQSHKRSYEQREESSSSEDGSSPRRQEDDILPKHKKRQPQVAAAYSRRW